MTVNTGELIKIIDLSETKTGNITTGNTEYVEIKPPEGMIYKIIGLGFYVPVVAAAGDGGNHRYRAGLDALSDTSRKQFFTYNSNYDSTIQVQYNNIAVVADLSQVPSADAEQIKVLDNMYASYDEPIYLVYANNATTATQTGNRVFIVKALVYRSVE